MVSMDQFYRLNGIVQRFILYIAFFPLPFRIIYTSIVEKFQIPLLSLAPKKKKEKKRKQKRILIFW